MTQASSYIAPGKRFSTGPYATTTARFDEVGDFSATAWQGTAPRPLVPARQRDSVVKRFASPVASTAFLAFILPVDPMGAEASPVGNVVASNGGRSSTQSNAADATIPEEGVYAPPRPRRVLLSEVVEFRTDNLPRRKPRIAADDSFLAVIDDE